MEAYIEKERILTTDDTLFARNLLNNSKEIVVDGTGQTEDYWEAFPIGSNFPAGTHITVSLESAHHEYLSIYGAQEDRKRFSSINPWPKGWNENAKQVKNVVDTPFQRQITFEINGKVDFNYLILWGGNPGENIRNTLHKVMVQVGDSATIWVPSPHDLDLVEKSDFDALKFQVDQLAKNQIGGEKISPLYQRF